MVQFSQTDPRNFEENNSAHTTYLNNLLYQTELRFFAPEPEIYEGQINPNGNPNIDDTRIRLEFTNIYYDIDATGWSNNGDACGNYSYNNLAINEDCELNIFIPGDTTLPFDGCAGYNYSESNNYIIMQVWEKFLEGAEYWDVGGTLAHEVGQGML